MFKLLKFSSSVNVIASLVSVGVNINTNKTVLENAALFDDRYYIDLLYYVHKHAETAAKTSSHSFQNVKIYNVKNSSYGACFSVQCLSDKL